MAAALRKGRTSASGSSIQSSGSHAGGGPSSFGSRRCVGGGFCPPRPRGGGLSGSTLPAPRRATPPHFRPDAMAEPYSFAPGLASAIRSGSLGVNEKRPPKGPLLLGRIRRRPTLPGGLPPSTIGAGGLNFRVRNGNGCDSAAMATGNLGVLLSMRADPQAFHSEHGHDCPKPSAD